MAGHVLSTDCRVRSESGLVSATGQGRVPVPDPRVYASHSRAPTMAGRLLAVSAHGVESGPDLTAGGPTRGRSRFLCSGTVSVCGR